MSRSTAGSIAKGLASCGIVLVVSCAAFAQGQSEPAAGQAPRLPRPEQQPVLEVQQPTAELKRLLEEWEKASSHISKLEGNHSRISYNTVFLTAKYALGVFYYEAPDKGRIDFDNPKGPLPQQQKKSHWETGKALAFRVEADHAEKWICDGQQILQINEEAKTAERFLIPEKSRGVNIMDGPLPFLFGMPAEKALKRYNFEVLNNNERECWLRVKTLWQQDKSNYQQATVILEKATYLPRAVQLIDPAGTNETVFTFKDLKVNEPRGVFKLFQKDPFAPKLRGYKVASHVGKTQAADPKQPPVVDPKQAGTTVPSVLHFPWETARDTLAKAGYAVRYEKGTPASREELVYVVYDQQPRPGTRLEKDQTIVLTLYTDIATASNK